MLDHLIQRVLFDAKLSIHLFAMDSHFPNEIRLKNANVVIGKICSFFVKGD
jgi:hypothetical protein